MKLLYVKCNPKSEEKSACLRAGRAFVHQYIRRFPDHAVEELDLYQTDLPELTAELIAGRSTPVSGSAYDQLSFEAQAQVDLAGALCTQFLSADVCAIAAPMWSLSFPPRLKGYIDCIVQQGRTIRITPNRTQGLLGNRSRRMVFIQSCGGSYSNPLTARFNHANNYLRSLFLYLGFDDYLRLGVDGTGGSGGPEWAISQAIERIDNILDDLMLD